MHPLRDWLWSQGVLPHGFCYQWNPVLVWLHAVSDTVIALAYYSIPIALVQFVRKRRDLPFSWMFVCFAAFIFACGSTHLVEVWTLWVPSYWFSAAVKVATALVSFPTAVFLVRLVPRALAIPSADELKAANEELRKQGATLKKSEERFRQMAENIQEIFWMLDPETKGAIYVSPAFEPICETPLEAIYRNSTSYRELIHPEDRRRVLLAIEELESTNRFEEEFRIVCPSGTVKWIRAVGYTAKNSAGMVATLVGTAQEITARKEMEFRLRDSEDRYRDLVEHSNDLICTHNLDGHLLWVNEPPIHLLGYSREELLNKPMQAFIVPEGRAEFEEYLRNIRTAGSAEGTMVVLTKGGERRVWEYQNTVRTDGVSTPIVRGIAHDVTEQKRMEKALRVSEEKFSTAFLASPYALAISTIDEDRLIEVNDGFCAISGYAREECIGRTFLDLGLWSGSSERNEILAEIRDKGRVRSKQVAFETKSHAHLIANYSAEVISLGRRRCLLSVCEDITDRKRAEARLLEYEKAFEGVEEMIAVVDRNYRYLLANHAFASLRGLAKDEVVGRRVPEVFGEEFFASSVKGRLDESFRGSIVRHEAAYPRQRGQPKEMLVSFFPIEEPSGVDRVVWVLHDITERKQAERELRRLSGRLLQSQDQERRKIARDLHDSTGQDLVALAAILNQLHAALPPAKRIWRRSISQCQAVVDRTLREVRTLSYVLHPPMLDEAGLEDAVRHFVHGFTQRTGIDVRLDVSSDFGRLPRDTEMGLFRVIQESLVNIQRHSGSRDAKITLIRDLGRIQLDVSDRGRGIPAEQLGPREALPQSMGVGIPSMEERVKQVGGWLELESSSAGTAVHVTVPLHG
jgi:PAS domain S-box-containing protein